MNIQKQTAIPSVYSIWLRRIFATLLIASLSLEIPHVLGELHATDLLGGLGGGLLAIGGSPILFAALTGLWLVVPAVPFLGAVSAGALVLLNWDNHKSKYVLLSLGLLLFADWVWLLVVFWTAVFNHSPLLGLHGQIIS